MVFALQRDIIWLERFYMILYDANLMNVIVYNHNVSICMQRECFLYA